MATHSDIKNMFIDVIDEYLSAARMCLENTKSDGGLHGYAATLLLFCAVEAMSSSLHRDQKRRCKIKDMDFSILTHPDFQFLELKNEQLRKLADFYRHKLVHNALLARCVALSSDDCETPFAFGDGGEPNTIYVRHFYRAVSEAWGRIDKGFFAPSGQGLGQARSTAQALAPGYQDSDIDSPTFTTTASGTTSTDGGRY